MARNTRGDKEYTRVQEVLHENKKLKREISQLRKQLARLDLDRLSYVKDIVEEHCAEERNEISTEKMLQKMKEEWRCKECNAGFLEIHLYTRPDGTWYYRLCNNCDHRTRSQQYNAEKVQGPIKYSSK